MITTGNLLTNLQTQATAQKPVENKDVAKTPKIDAASKPEIPKTTKTESPQAPAKPEPKSSLQKNIRNGVLIVAGAGLFAAAFINTKVSLQKVKELNAQLSQRLKNFDSAIEYIKTEAQQAHAESLEKISSIYKEAIKPFQKGELKTLEQKLRKITSFEDAKAFQDAVEEFIQTKFGEYADDPMFQKLFEKGEKIATDFSEKIAKKQNQVIASFEKESALSDLSAGLLHDERCFKAIIDHQNKMKARLEASQASYFNMKLGLHNKNREFMAEFSKRAIKLTQKTKSLQDEAKAAIEILDPKNDPLKGLLGGLGISRN